MKQTKPACRGYFLRRLLVYTVGLLILTMGVSLSVKSDLGISPVNSFPYVVSRITESDQGFWTTLVFIVYVLVQILLLGRKFRPIQLTQVIAAIAFGAFVSLCNRLLAFPVPEQYLLRVALMIAGIVCMSVGLFLYLATDLIPQPADGFCLVVQQKTGWQYGNIKCCMDCTMVALSALLSYLCTGSVIGVREGTLLAMLTIGKLCGLFHKRFGRRVHVFCFGAETI